MRPTGLPRRVVAALAAAALALPLPAAAAQDGGSAKPDRVLSRNPRTGAVGPTTGTVTESTLSEVVVEDGDRTRRIDSALVVRVVFGDVPSAYREGLAYLDRGDHENAAAKFRLAATDTEAREVVRADARLRAAAALLARGAADPGAFEEAAAEAETFLTDHPSDRQVPRARMLRARATRLAGDAAGAAELYAEVFREAEGGTPPAGYDWATTLAAGLEAAHAHLAAGDATAARELFGQLDATLLRVLGTLPEDDPQRSELLALQARSRLGEGWTLLAAGQHAQAKTFFRGQLASAGSEDPSLLYGARLGLAEALFAEGSLREAEVEFATVSALDPGDRDRIARALVGLAEVATAAGDPDARARARGWLQAVLDHYGDTPAVRRAQEMLSSL